MSASRRLRPSAHPHGLAIAALAAALTGCSWLPSADRTLSPLTPYKLEVVQGNIVTKEQAAQVKPGMSRAQVRDALGSPLLTDIFHADRWDYVFTIRRQGAEPQARHVVALFDGETLKSLDTNGELPGEHEFVASIDTARAPSTPPTLALTEEQRRALPTPPPAPPADVVPEVPPRTYPPLEPAAP